MIKNLYLNNDTVFFLKFKKMSEPKSILLKLKQIKLTPNTVKLFNKLREIKRESSTKRYSEKQ